MSVVGFLVRPRADLGGVVAVVPTIDDVELTDLIHEFERVAAMETRDVSYGGLIPSFYNFAPMQLHFLGAPSGSLETTPLLGCSCGEWGCWPLQARISATQDSVVWNAFEQPFRKERDYSMFGPFTFDRNQYDRALDELRGTLA